MWEGITWQPPFSPFPRSICDMSKRGWEKKGGDTKEKRRNEIRKAGEKSWKKALEYIFNWTSYATKPRVRLAWVMNLRRKER